MSDVGGILPQYTRIQKASSVIGLVSKKERAKHNRERTDIAVFLSEQMGVRKDILHQQINWISSVVTWESGLIWDDIPSVRFNGPGRGGDCVRAQAGSCGYESVLPELEASLCRLTRRCTVKAERRLKINPLRVRRRCLCLDKRWLLAVLNEGNNTYTCLMTTL